MAFGFSRAREPGWTAVSLLPERIDLAQVDWNAAGRPALRRFESWRREGEPAAMLARLRRERGLGRSRCALLLAPGEYRLLQVEAPAVEAAELKAALRWRVKDLLDYPVESATLDAIPVPASAPGRPAQAFVAAAPSALIGARMKAFQEAHVTLDAIDIPELAQRNLAALFEQPERALALLAFDDGGASLTFTCAGELYAFRRIELDVSQLTGAEDGLRSALFDRITLELQRTLDGLDRQFSSIAVSRLVVAEPEGARLVAHLSANLATVVERLDVSAAVALDALPEPSRSEIRSRALAAIGAALRREEPRQ